ncbi:MAG: DUF5060 domain-containing protein, partial [Bacteroidia bacterium]|nr:DUF5060 domain-containing protein [Bacteroidia bacterium]
MNLYFSFRKPALRFLTVLVSVLLSFSQSVICQNIDKDNSVDLRSQGEFKFGEISINSDKIGLFEKFEASFSLTGEWDNPFDPDQIKVDAVFHTPDGKQFLVPGFFYQDYKHKSYNEIEKTGSPVWKIRFTPATEGEYKFEVKAKNNGKEISSLTKSFNAISFKSSHGFLRISGVNPLYFEYDDGFPFFAVAVDNAVSSYVNYMNYYRRFAGSGGNYNRLFIMSGDLDLGEETRPNAGPDRGLGKINMDASWKLDKVIELGEILGIYHQMCMTNQYNFNLGWKNNVFN